jgi:hypothetical protein
MAAGKKLAGAAETGFTGKSVTDAVGLPAGGHGRTI